MYFTLHGLPLAQWQSTHPDLLAPGTFMLDLTDLNLALAARSSEAPFVWSFPAEGPRTVPLDMMDQVIALPELEWLLQPGPLQKAHEPMLGAIYLASSGPLLITRIHLDEVWAVGLDDGSHVVLDAHRMGQGVQLSHWTMEGHQQGRKVITLSNQPLGQG